MAAAAIAALIVMATAALWQSRGRVTATAVEAAAADNDRAPTDARYQQAVRVGLSGDRAKAAERLLELARSEKGSNTGAWSLYQAALAAKALKQPAESAARLAELRRDYPDHPLAARFAAGARSPAAPERGPSDCGPRSLLYLCERAGIRATLEELTERCATDKHGTTLDRLQSAARQKGLKAEAAHVDAAYLRRHRPSGIAWVSGDHYVAFLPVDGRDQFLICDANRPKPEPVATQELAKRSQGIVLLTAWGKAELPPVGNPGLGLAHRRDAEDAEDH